MSEEYICSAEFLKDFRWRQIRLEVLRNQKIHLGKISVSAVVTNRTQDMP